MRLGEIKSILDAVLDEDNHIILDQEAIFGGQAYLIKNYQELMGAVNILVKQSWNDLDFEGVDTIWEKYPNSSGSVQITSEEYNRLNSYISELNKKLPFSNSTLYASFAISLS